MKVKIIMLIFLSIGLLVLFYLYYEKLVIFNNKYQTLVNKVNSLEKYYNYSFFTNNNKDEFNKIKNILDNNLQSSNQSEKITYRLTKLENNIKNILMKEIKNKYFQIISRKSLLNNKYKKLNLGRENKKAYNKIIDDILKNKDFILKNDGSLYSLDKLFAKYQIAGSYKISYLKYLNESKLNNLKIIKKQQLKNNDYLMRENKNFVKKKTTNKRNIKSSLKNNNCLGTLYYSKHEVDSKQKKLLNEGKASSVYQINNKWCLIAY